ncbi:MAG: hypothetical protein M3290_01495, partial [Actinomycetota bacterium]|nr:hypothetical protein [Actinomycetota bacterium]
MADLNSVYQATKSSIVELARAHENELDRPVPATAEWSARDVLGHLVGNVEGVLRGDFPADFFTSFGEAGAVAGLNEWTARQLHKHEHMSLNELITTWDEMTPALFSMMRGDTPWPDGVFDYADRAITIDLGVHQQDLYGAFGIKAERDSAVVKVGTSAYVAILNMRLQSDGVGAVAIEVPGKRWVAGGDDPQVTLRTDRFELFRSMAGRRSPE